MSVADSHREHWIREQEARKRSIPDESAPPLKGGGGGGTSDDMTPLKDYVDARDEAVESRLSAKLDKLPSRGEMWGMAAATVGGVFGITLGALAFMAFAGDRFDAGMSVSPTIAAAQQRQAEVDRKQDAQLAVMDDKLDILINQTR